MSIQVKPAGAWRTVTQPWIKPDDIAHRKATKVFNKIAGVWRESWPLQPGPTSAPITTTTYRNDRIEIDVDWDAPITGEPVAKYFVTVAIIGSGWSVTVEVTAPTTALTLTNGGVGFHHLAGYTAVSTVYAQTAAGRNGDAVTGLGVGITQLPPPPQPTSYSVGMNQCALTHSWSHSGGRRIDGVEIHVTHNGAGHSAWFAAGTTSAGFQPWNTSTIGGGHVICYCRTYGPGGVSNWVTVSGTMPNAIGTSQYRFGDGYLRVYTSGISPAVQIHVVRYGGNWVYDGDFGAGAGEVYAPQSVNWARDRTYYSMLLRPVNNANGWVGRDQWLGWAMKLPNPHFISPIDSHTWRGYGWRAENHADYQGATRDGLNAAFFFYGNQFYDLLSAAVVGYDIGITWGQIALHREGSGWEGAISPQLMVHRAGWIGEDFTWGGNYATWGLVPDQLAWVPVPTDWIWYLKERYDGWRGIGLYYPDTGLNPYIGNVSAEYMVVKAWDWGTIDGGAYWLDTVGIYHNG